MPTTFSDIVPVRRVAVGDCSGPLGSGFDALARSAYAALLRADWTQSADPPFLPVHDNGQTANKTIPRGDAWKCSYGYDATARTERSACGAVCYTFALPGDAYSPSASAYSETTNYAPGDRAKHEGVVYVCIAATSGAWDSSAWEEVEVADISTVALSLTGDRYLDAGVDLYLVPSESPTPPAITDLLAITPVGTYCATSDQSPTPPNERHGVTEAVTATPGVAARPYLHVALLLHDYTTNRGAWIEGGAMLEGAAATIGFSRNVEIAPTPVTPISPFLAPVYPSDLFNIGGTGVNLLPAGPLSWIWNYNTEEADVGRFWIQLRALCSGAAAETARQLNGGSFPPSPGPDDLTGFELVGRAANGVACRAHLEQRVVGETTYKYMYSYGTVTIYDASSLYNGGTIVLANTRSSVIAGSLIALVSAVEIDNVTETPNFGASDLFYGSGEHGLGAVEFVANTVGRLTLSRPPKTGFVGIVCTPRGGDGIFAAPSVLPLE